MKKNILNISKILIFVSVFGLLSDKAISAPLLMPKVISLEYIKGVNGDVSLVHGDENFFLIAGDEESTGKIFGEDAFSEDNILKHYFFNNKIKTRKNRVMNKPYSNIEKNIYTKTQ